MTDEIRAALHAYAATAPDLDPALGLRERITRRERRRRAAIAAVACLAALVAGTGVAALGHDGRTTGLVATDPTQEPTGTPTEAAEPTPSATPPAEPTATPSPTRAAETTPPPSEGSSAAPWTPYPKGLDITATLDPAGPETAIRGVLRVHTEDTDGFPQVRGVSWGDGTSEVIAIAEPSCAQPDTYPTARPPRPGHADPSYWHAWRVAGTYTVTVSVVSGTACDPLPAEDEQRTVTLRVAVAEGEVVSNGPARPVAELGTGPYEVNHDPHDVSIYGSIRDADGWVGAVTIDYNDGSEVVTLTNDAPCEDGDGTYYPRSDYSFSDWHAYDPGAHTITVTWTSAGCDGGDEQTGERSYDVTVPS
jgi:hypothetical protein